MVANGACTGAVGAAGDGSRGPDDEPPGEIPRARAPSRRRLGPDLRLARKLGRAAVLLDERLRVVTGDRVGDLDGRRLHQVRARRLERTAEAVVEAELA